jgi:vacuolar-type H+-ATPase subunit I/STV1
MTLPSDPSEPSDPQRSRESPSNRIPPEGPEGPDRGEWVEIDRGVQEIEESLHLLKERIIQVKSDRQRQRELQNRRDDIRREVRQAKQTNPSLIPELKQELKQIQANLEAIELNLESELFSFSALKEPFWQAIRFGGIGIIIGWLLRAWIS